MVKDDITDYLSNISSLASKAKDIYDRDVKKNLEIYSEKITEILYDIVNDKESSYGLVLGNDSNKNIKLYNINSRVKESDSLREKVVRDQVFYSLLDVDDDKIANVILDKFDDLIGVRFLVSLSCDCDSLFKLLVGSVEELREKGIVFKNFESNPETMNNGRQIYRLKGIYTCKGLESNKSVQFELQIKSKVDSAWADIEHMLFYKNFNFSYIQSTNKAVMNKIGDLLEQTDKLMVEVRNSQESYEDAVDGLEFDQYLRQRYVRLVNNHLGSPYLLSEHKDLLFSIFSDFKKPHKKSIIALKDAPKDDTIYSFTPNEELAEKTLFKNYLKLRKSSIELIFFECILCEWKAYYDGVFKEISEEDLRKFVCNLCSKVAEKYIGDTSEIDINNYKLWFSETLTRIIDIRPLEFSNRLFIFNKKQMEQISVYWKVRAKNLANFDEVEKEIILFDELFIIYLLNSDKKEQFEEAIVESFFLDESRKLREYFSKMNFDVRDEYEKIQISKSRKNKGVHRFNSFYDFSTSLEEKEGEL